MKTNKPKKPTISAQVNQDIKDWLDSRRSKGLGATNKLVNDLLNDRMLSEQAAWSRGERFEVPSTALTPFQKAVFTQQPVVHAYGETDDVPAPTPGMPTCEHGRTIPHRIGTGNTTGPICHPGTADAGGTNGQR